MNVPTMADYMVSVRRFDRHIRESGMDCNQVFYLYESILKLNSKKVAA